MNTTADPTIDLAQPSGTLIRNTPDAAEYGTYAWLSGMSPGGELSICGAFVDDVEPPAAPTVVDCEDFGLDSEGVEEPVLDTG